VIKRQLTVKCDHLGNDSSELLLLTRLQNSHIFGGPEQCGQLSNKRSGAGVEMARKAGERRNRKFPLV